MMILSFFKCIVQLHKCIHILVQWKLFFKNNLKFCEWASFPFFYNIISIHILKNGTICAVCGCLLVPHSLHFGAIPEIYIELQCSWFISQSSWLPTSYASALLKRHFFLCSWDF